MKEPEPPEEKRRPRVRKLATAILKAESDVEKPKTQQNRPAASRRSTTPASTPAVTTGASAHPARPSRHSAKRKREGRCLPEPDHGGVAHEKGQPCRVALLAILTTNGARRLLRPHRECRGTPARSSRRQTASANAASTAVRHSPETTREATAPGTESSAASAPASRSTCSTGSRHGRTSTAEPGLLSRPQDC